MTNKPKSGTTSTRNNPNSTSKPVNGSSKGASTNIPTAPRLNSATVASKSKDKRRAQAELQRKQAQQAQRIIVMIGAAALLVAVVVVIVLSSRPADIAFADNVGAAQYAGIPSGLTTSGPNGVTYPVPMPYLGSPTAPVRLEEISSFSCPFCLQYHDDHFSQIVDEIKAGRAQYIYLPTIRTGDFNAEPGTRAAYCAAKQGQFWPMQDILFDWQKRYASGASDLNRLEAAAQKLNLNMSQYDACFSSTEARNYSDAASLYSEARGLVGTPSVFLFVGNQQIKLPPNPNASNVTPGSIAAMDIGTLRGIIEANALKMSYSYF